MIISIANPKGGVGKTMLATNLSVAMCGDILELDAQRSSSLWAADRNEQGIHPAVQVLTVKSARDIAIICEPYDGNRKSLLLVDCAGLDSDYNREAMALSDLIVIPLRPSQVEVYALSRTASVLTAVNRPGYVLDCGAFPASIGKVRALADAVDGFKLLKTVVRYRADYQEAYGAGHAVTETSRWPRGAEEISVLASELKRLLKGVK